MRLYLHRSISEKKFENVDLEKKKSGIAYISTSVLFFRTEVVKLIIFWQPLAVLKMRRYD